MNGVVIDKAFDRGTIVYAVVWEGDLLPVRFTKKWEAREHLDGLRYGAGQPRGEKAAQPVEAAA